MRLSDLQKKKKSLTVEYAGETLTVEYRHATYTPAFLDRMGDKSVSDVLAELLSSWDLTDDKDKPLPISAEQLNNLPVPFLRAVWDTVREDIYPNPDSTAASGSFS